MNKKILLVGLGVVVALALALADWSRNNRQAQALVKLAAQDNSVFNRPYSPVHGPATAKVKIVEFFDPACEACRAFYPFVKQLVDGQQGKVQLVMRYAAFHQGSDQAVKILEAARLQGLFWPVAEAMLRGQPQWADHGKPQPELIWGLLGDTGLNIRKARDDAAAPPAQVSLDQDMADAKFLEVAQTPGFFVNGKPLVSFGYEQLRALVEQEVKLSYAP